MQDRVEHLKSVFAEFQDEIVASSSVYSTPPWGDTDQDEFYNAIIIVEVDQTPLELLHRGQALERRPTVCGSVTGDRARSMSIS